MIISLVNSKGGVGKSTIAVHLAVWLFDLGHSVALVDCDKQRSSSTWLAEAEPDLTVRIAEKPDDCIVAIKELAETHRYVIGDGPAGLDEISRTLLLLSDLALFPITPSVLDARSVRAATEILSYAQAINDGRPHGKIVLNKTRKRDTITRELQTTATMLGLQTLPFGLRELAAFRKAPQQKSVVTRLRSSTAIPAAADVHAICAELFPAEHFCLPTGGRHG